MPVYIGHAYDAPAHGHASSSHAHVSSVPLYNGDAEANEAERRRVKRFLLERGYTGYEFAIRPGSAWRVIPDLAASFECGLVVMGARDHSVWERVVGKAHAEHALSELPCDVLFVKDRDFKCPVRANSEDLIAIRDD